ncbi:hypothetical protein NVP1072O_51 [Vibrio phage 1.072.O._10N.286.48.A12]|nr:hypothetical protein NVP1004O_50 [Vibrio phage 1.004.O._10N.261.54.A2]AUR83610.1 hypothetical protein NVP1037O_50 [Vibrio phage 1.037.O._10N.261.52.F7]AUR84495.1 hypothetical protein NVP1056O_53 [Vibrio phage 1.056.O._10N.261.48.C11]AUR85012.1 hypothetical protein NVP1066O_53 [Vibrio phage 1.066.O._10N.286.46.E8]AUR85143.1 hypothetical protein NVP1068O_53 [Vibrio phage 1.068.O._10N.261.51.F8]AUR85368.1 hypothetical protein NVP1072O_51 [Vibrio phage 1.072.O._10N.286.48.A12]
MKTIAFIVVVCAALWFTRPASVMSHCLDNNTVYSCQYLDKE